MQGVRFWGARERGGAELVGSVMGGHEVEEVQADVLGAGIEVLPLIEFEISPKFIEQFETERDVAHHFSVEGLDLVEASLGIGVFPELAAVVEKDARDEEVAIEFRVDRVQGQCAAHHLGDVFYEAASARVVVFFRGGGPFKTIPKLSDEGITERLHAWIGEISESIHNGGPILFLLGACHGIAGEKVGLFIVIEKTEFPAFAIDPVLVLRPIAMEVEKGFFVDFSGRVPLRVIIPELQRDPSGGIGDGPFTVGFAALRLALADALELGAKTGFERGFAGALEEVANRHGLTKTNHVLHGLFPKEKKSARGISEVAVSGERDHALLQVVVELLLHLLFETLDDLIGVGDHEICFADLEFGEVLLVLLEDGGEAAFLARKVPPARFWSVQKGGRKRVVRGVDVPAIAGATADGHECEGDILMLTETD